MKYIQSYIYSHPQVDCFVPSELFSVARHAVRSKPGSKPIQLYVRLSLSSPMAREIWAQSQVESYRRLKKWYLMLSCLTLSIIRYVSRVKWSNPGNGVAPSPTPRCSSYPKGSPRVNLDYGRKLYLLTYKVRERERESLLGFPSPGLYPLHHEDTPEKWVREGIVVNI